MSFAQVDLDLACALHRVDAGKMPFLAAESVNLPDRMDHADLLFTITIDDQMVSTNGRPQFFQTDNSIGFDVEVGGPKPRALELAHRVEDRLVLGLLVTMCLPFVL